jgi:hypothetical protein
MKNQTLYDVVKKIVEAEIAESKKQAEEEFILTLKFWREN